MQGTWALTLRTLRQDSRQLRFHLLRLGVAFLLLLAVWGMQSSSQYLDAPGRELLSGLAAVSFFFITVVGVLLFAPSITEEKAEQTLGLLRMTGIGPASLVLGKTIPRLIQFGLVLIIQLPLVWLTPTLGGVDWPLILNIYAVLFVQLLGTVAISMLASVIMRTSGGAVVAAGLAVFLWVMSPEIAADIKRSAQDGSVLAASLQPLAELVASLSLRVKMDGLLRSGTRVSGTATICGANLLLATVVFLTAIWSFNFWNRHETTQTEWEWLQEKWHRVWQAITRRLFRRRAVVSSTASLSGQAQPSDQPSSAEAGFLPDAPPAGRSRPSHRSWQNALAWKEYFLLGGGRQGLRIRCAIAGLGGIALALAIMDIPYRIFIGQFPIVWDDHWFSVAGEAITVCSFYAFIFDLIYLTVNLFGYELKSQTWESLQLLPVSLGKICRQRIWGAAIHLIPWVVAFVIGVSMTLDIVDLWQPWDDIYNHPWVSLAVVLQVVVHVVTALLVLTRLSLRFNPWVTIVITGVLFWMLGIAFVITAFMAYGFLGPSPPDFYGAIFHISWITASCLTSGLLLRSVRSRLQGEAPHV